MCGIAGYVASGQKPDLMGMTRCIAHRGPDGQGHWEKGSFGLGHVRLSIIDLSDQADQPMTDPETGNVLVFNGEIYNYKELREELKGSYAFRTESDTEVILALYRKLGAEGLKQLRGMFAIALYDAAQERLLLARDRIGIKPLYYMAQPGRLLFASEIKTLRNTAGNNLPLNERKVYEFLVNRQLDTDCDTFFKDILQLAPGTYIYADAQASCTPETPFWNFPPPGRRRWNQEAQAEFLEVFRDTIALHLRSDVPVGSFVSGGLDSSSIACFAEEQSVQPLHTYSGTLPYHHSENSLIGEITERGRNIIPHYFPLDGEGFFDDLPQVIYHHDEPILDGSMYSHYKLCQMAGRDGIKVLLSGAGGDELMGGYASHLYAHLGQLIRKGRLGSYRRQLREIAANSMYSMPGLLSKSLFENLPMPVRRRLKNIQLKRRATYLDFRTDVPHFTFDHADLYYANWINNYRSWTVPPYLHYEDRNSMAFGVEIRVPFYDHKLIEFVAQFDPSDLVSGRSKGVMRSSFRGVVPDKILDQKDKYGFPSPIDHALRQDPRGKAFFEKHYKETPFLHEQGARQLFLDFYSGKGEVAQYFRLLSYMIWYQQITKGSAQI